MHPLLKFCHTSTVKICAFICVSSTFLYATFPLPKLHILDEPVRKSPNKQIEEHPSLDVDTVSKAFGHLVGKNIHSMGKDLDITQVIEGIEEAISGKKSPMGDLECMEALSSIQEKQMETALKNNLFLANAFMEENKEKKGIIEMEGGKLQFRIDQEGKGNQVEPHSFPLIHYTGSFLNGEPFTSSEGHEMISLDEAIPGFTKGIIGMREGEKRTLFIHPELGYGTSGYLPPNSLLTFEVEVLQANASSNPNYLPDYEDNLEDEIAMPDITELPTEEIR